MLAYRSARRGWVALAATVLLAVLLTLVIALPRGAAPPPPTVPGNPTGAQPGPAAPGDTLTRSRDRSGGGLAGASAQRTFS